MVNRPQDFFDRVEKDPQTGCWTWTGPERFSMFCKSWRPHILAHRITNRWATGYHCVVPCPISDECINPQHSHLISRREKNRELARRKRTARVEADRNICLLRYAEGETLAQIAEDMGTTTQTISRRIRSHFGDWPKIPEIRRRIKQERPSAVEALAKAREQVK